MKYQQIQRINYCNGKYIVELGFQNGIFIVKKTRASRCILQIYTEAQQGLKTGRLGNQNIQIRRKDEKYVEYDMRITDDSRGYKMKRGKGQIHNRN